MIQFKAWFLQNYVWLLIILFLVSFITLLGLDTARKPEAILCSIAIYMAIFFFSQKQRLEGQRLTAELFGALNLRYAALQAKLNAICSVDPSSAPAEDEIHILGQYFNLCSEEYFHFTSGLIPAEVWESWLNGMRVYYYHPRIRLQWDRELKQKSLYGFNANLLK